MAVHTQVAQIRAHGPLETSCPLIKIIYSTPYSTLILYIVQYIRNAYVRSSAGVRSKPVTVMASDHVTARRRILTVPFTV